MRTIFILLLSIFFSLSVTINYPQNFSSNPSADKIPSLSDGEALIWYLGHCGYAVKTKTKLLIFDYQEKVKLPDKTQVTPPSDASLFNGWINPAEIKDLDVWVFSSHSHSDHYDEIIFSWEKTIKNIHYVFGWQEKDGNNYYSLPAPRKDLILNGIEVYTVNSHHSGVPESGFLVKTDGLTIFHQGDYIGKMGENAPFKITDDLKYLKTKYNEIDLLFSHAGEWDPQPEMMQSFNAKVNFPMHYGYREEKYTDYYNSIKEKYKQTIFCIPQKKGDNFHYKNGTIIQDKKINGKALSETLSGPYLGQKPPGLIPEPFAPDLMTSEMGYHSTIVFSADLKEALWRPMDKNEGKLFYSVLKNNVWSKPELINFGMDDRILDPFFSPDGKRIYFLSFKPDGDGKNKRERIWFVEKTGEGWSVPKLTDKVIYNHPTHWTFSAAMNGNIYFTSEASGVKGENDIYVSKFVNNKYMTPEDLGPAINSDGRDFTPFIASDESYLIFARIDGSTQASDLLISFKDAGGKWTKAVTLGDKINSDSYEYAPCVSPDGKYLFYISQKNKLNQMLWVSTDIFKTIRTKQ